MLQVRASGLLLHITSLPSPYGIGDLGPEAYRFVDFLADSDQAFWQILPLNPTSGISGHSPYSSASAFAGNPWLISPDLLVEDGLLQAQEAQSVQVPSTSEVDYPAAVAVKTELLQKAFARFPGRKPLERFEAFLAEQAYWLEDFALYQGLKGYFGWDKGWNEWPSEVRNRDPQALEACARSLEDRLAWERFLQYLFQEQWMRLKAYCREKQVQIIGDLPIYVSFDSADVWAHPEIFKLDADLRPTHVAGVPPDYFSSTGQLWGNPVFDWSRLQSQGYRWWLQRMARNLELYDVVRIDHFRGFVGYWEVEAGEETAVNGSWAEVPSFDFFRTLYRRFPQLPVIAEDLGEITPDVREVMAHFGFPGMKILLFAFDWEDPYNVFLPHTYPRNCVAYTGTHDTNTVRGWFEEEADRERALRMIRYLGRETGSEEIHWDFIRLGLGSVANLMITPVQDLLGLSSSARMNLPATASGNWLWRLQEGRLNPDLARKLAQLTRTFGRC